MATKPAKNPLVVKPASHFLLDLYAQNIAVNPAAQAARVVFVATRPMPSKSIAESVLPGLKPYQPNHRINPPMVWTTVDPAKSWKPIPNEDQTWPSLPIRANQPSGPQAQ